MSRLSDISASPTLREFAQGAAQSAIMPVADFLAPTVEVATSVGRFKSYTEKHRFHIPDTLRTLGGRASELRFEVTDATFNCEPHALDFPIDNLEQLEADGLENMLREGAVAVAEVSALSHEKSVIDAALAAVGAGTGKTWNASADRPGKPTWPHASNAGKRPRPKIGPFVPWPRPRNAARKRTYGAGNPGF